MTHFANDHSMKVVLGCFFFCIDVLYNAQQYFRPENHKTYVIQNTPNYCIIQLNAGIIGYKKS